MMNRFGVVLVGMTLSFTALGLTCGSNQKLCQCETECNGPNPESKHFVSDPYCAPINQECECTPDPLACP